MERSRGQRPGRQGQDPLPAFRARHL